MEQKTEDGGQRTAGMEALKPCPFCGAAAIRALWAHYDGTCARGASCGNTSCELFGRNFTRTWWNTRKPERDEFGQIIAGLKARGVITQADVDRLERDGMKEVAP